MIFLALSPLFLSLAFSLFMVVDVSMPDIIIKKPFGFLRKMNKLMKKKKFKITKKTSSVWSNSWSASYLRRYILDVSYYDTFIEFKFKFKHSTIIKFHYSRLSNTISDFHCDNNVKIKGNEMFILECLKNAIHFFFTEMETTKQSEDIFNEFLRITVVKTNQEMNATDDKGVPKDFQSIVYEINTLSEFLSQNKEDLDVEKVHYVQSFAEDKIPTILEKFHRLSSEDQITHKEGTLATLEKIKESFSKWKKEIEHESAKKLKRQLETVMVTLKND